LEHIFEIWSTVTLNNPEVQRSTDMKLANAYRTMLDDDMEKHFDVPPYQPVSSLSPHPRRPRQPP
jgi:hypothetical protein